MTESDDQEQRREEEREREREPEPEPVEDEPAEEAWEPFEDPSVLPGNPNVDWED